MSKLRLDSWKAIADYLERSPRTVQRWHAYHALPVHHFGGFKGSVFAYAEEIDRWLVNLAKETTTHELDEETVLEARRSRSDELAARAREMWESRSEESLNEIASLYRRAIDQNPGNAMALTGLANAMISAALQGVMDGAIAYPSAMEALRRTAQLAAEDVESACSAAWLNTVYEHKWRQASAGFEDALNRRPQNSFALAGMAVLHIAQDDLAGASNWAWKAWRQNALVCPLGALLCWTQYLLGDFASALETVAQVQMSSGCSSMLAVIEMLALIQLGEAPVDVKRMEAVAGSFPQNATLQGALGYAYAAGGQTEAAWEIREKLEQLSKQKQRSHAYGLALVCLGLGYEQESVRWLETSFTQGSLWGLGLQSDPMLLRLRPDPHFRSLLRKFASPTPAQTKVLAMGTLATA